MDNEKSKQPKTIGIDARLYGFIGRGIGRYIKENLDRIVEMDSVNNYVVFLSKENFNEFKPKNKKIKKILAPFRWYTLEEQRKMPKLISKEKIDLMHFSHFNVPYFCPAKFIVTIHDLILTEYPSKRATTLNPIFYKFKNFGYKKIIKNAIKKSEIIIAVSEFTKNDIIKKFGSGISASGSLKIFSDPDTDVLDVLKDKIKVIYEGTYNKIQNPIPSTRDKIQNNNNEIEEKILSQYKIKKPYLLYVGSAYPHKNLEGLINIFLKIREKKPDLSLVLVGKEDYFYNRLKNLVKNIKNGESIIFTGFVPDNELNIFYQNAEVFVFPSLYEGFGLPPLEAMQQGCPVASSNKTCLPEILGDSAQYFNPDDQKEAANRILEAINDENLRKDLVGRGYKQAAKYSWDKCAKKILNIYFKTLCK